MSFRPLLTQRESEMATTRVTHSKGTCAGCDIRGFCRKCGWCETDGLHWEKTADGPVLMNTASEKHRCTGAPAMPSVPPHVTVPASAPVSPDWLPAEPEKWVCTFKHTHTVFATWVHKDNAAHGIPWTACDEHVPRIGKLESILGHEPEFTGIEPEPATSLPEYDGTFVGPQKAELVHSLKLGMHCLLVGPTATGKSLCTIEAFAHTDPERPVIIIEGHEI